MKESGLVTTAVIHVFVKEINPASTKHRGEIFCSRNSWPLDIAAIFTEQCVTVNPCRVREIESSKESLKKERKSNSLANRTHRAGTKTLTLMTGSSGGR